MQLELEPAECELLIAVLETALGTLREEIYKTETLEFEMALKEREVMLTTVLERARTGAAAPAQSVALQAEVLEALRGQAQVDPAEIAVTVDDGVVALSGRVPSFAAREAAEAAALGAPDVRDLVDDIDVADLTHYHEGRADEEIAHDIRRALVAHLAGGDDDIKTAVSHGVVALHGSVETWQMVAAAEAAAADVAGVMDVEDDLVVRPAALEVEIGQALEHHPGHPLHDLDVQVEDGVVTLSGPIASWAERDMAMEVARLVPGVQDVRDRLHLRAYRTAW